MVPVTITFLSVYLKNIGVQCLTSVTFVTILFNALVVVGLCSTIPSGRGTLGFATCVVFALVLCISTFMNFLAIFRGRQCDGFSVLDWEFKILG